MHSAFQLYPIHCQCHIKCNKCTAKETLRILLLWIIKIQIGFLQTTYFVAK
jgi:hypothetical protein